MSKWLQGTFIPVNRNKCVNTKPIVYRSSYELRFLNFCDQNKSIIKWGSEVITIQYINEVDGKPHKYTTDFYIEVKDINGNLNRKIIEIKPSKQSALLDESGNLILPKPPKKKSAKALQNYYNSVNEIRKNHSKWTYAREFCKQHGIEFQVLTEKDIFNGKR